MTGKKSSLAVFLFILIIACIFSGVFTVIGVVGWKLFKASTSTFTQSKTVSKAHTKVPSSDSHRISVVTPPQSKSREQTSHPLQSHSESSAHQLPIDPRERFLLGLKQCMAHTPEQFPCAWQDTQAGVIKQFKMDKPYSPMIRRVFDMGGQLLNLTSFNTQYGYVSTYRENKMNWFFNRRGIVQQIAHSSRENPNLQDYYYYTVTGQLSSCICADKTQTCCEEAPRLTSPGNTYCELFPLDAEFCVK